MKLLAEINLDKLRGGFYTPPKLVDHCLNRIASLGGDFAGRWLEPSAGDGAFVRGLRRTVEERRRDRIEITAVEPAPAEAAKCGLAMRGSRLRGAVVIDSLFRWAEATSCTFDVVIGNPPFVRYQFVDATDRRRAERLLRRAGIELRGVSNLWIAIVLVALNLLKDGGRFSMVLPGELFCTASGGQFREYVVRNFGDLTVDLFPRGSFPNILQDVVIVSGRRRAAETARQVWFEERSAGAGDRWCHIVPATPDPWMRHLLNPRQLAAFDGAKLLPAWHALGSVARLEVSVVTGANAFFTVAEGTLAEYRLEAWALPLLARTGDAPGVIFTADDHAGARADGRRAWLLDFSEGRKAPNGRGRVSEYLAAGEAEGLPLRYKCRIREPWYRVPQVRRGTLMMTKRAHHHHRLLLNEAGVYTTDTIYRGGVRPLYAGRERDLVAGFQNTLTLLSCELEGRTYGGGVLELVPSEIARVTVPLVETGDLLKRVDVVSRRVGGQGDGDGAVLKFVDAELCRRGGYAEVLPELSSALERLRGRRQASTTASDQPGSLSGNASLYEPSEKDSMVTQFPT